PRPAAAPSRARTPPARSRSGASAFGARDCGPAIKDAPDTALWFTEREYHCRSVCVRARNRNLCAGLGRIGGRDRVSHADLPSDEDLGAKSAAMNQPGEHAPSRQAFDGGARLAPTDAAEPNAAPGELPATRRAIPTPTSTTSRQAR